MSTAYTYTKSVALRHTVDLFIAGGGPSGVAAALTAARQGKRVFLAELAGFFGGGATAQLVPAFMPFTDGIDFLAGGVGREIYDAVTGGGPLNHDSIPVHPETLKALYDRLMSGSGAQFSFFTTLLDVACDAAGHVDHVLLHGKSGLFAVKADVYLDCTGDGDLCALAGAPFGFGDDAGRTMASTLCSQWAGVDWSQAHQPDDRALDRAIADGVFSVPDRHLPGFFPIGRTLGGGNIGHCYEVDGTDERSLTRGMLEGRARLPEYERYYKAYLDGYDKMELCATAPYLGVRESRRITGDYVLCERDFLDRASFPDEIGRFSYPVDIHGARPGDEEYARFQREFRSMRYKKGESYGIPYRALTPQGLDNVLVAGRCISTDRSMQASVRVMPCCYITGQAVGMAAAMALEHGGDVRAVSVPALQQRLAGMGAYLPNL